MQSTQLMPPKDSYHIVYISCFVLGVGTLFAWNALITAANYFSSRFCGTSYEGTFEEDIGLAYMSANVASLAMAVRYQDYIDRRMRVLTAIIAYFFLFAGITAMVLFPGIASETVYAFTLVAGALSGVFCAFLTGGVFAMVSQFPGVYVGAVMSGQGLSGLTASLVSLGTALASDFKCTDDDGDDDDNDDDSGCSDYDNIDYGSFSYFMVACVIFLGCIIAFVVMDNAPFAQYYDEKKHEDGHEDVYSPLDEGNQSDAQPVDPTQVSLRESNKEIDAYKPVENEGDIDTSLWTILRAVRHEAFSAWAVFTVTIAIFPGITALMRPAEHCTWFPTDLFTPYMFLLFNGVDLIGRTAAGFIQLIPARSLPFLCVLRLVFIPLFALTNVSGSRLPTVFPGVWWPTLFMVTMALSNGYFSTLAMIYGPLRVNHHQSEMAGSVMIFALTLGLFCGAMSAYLVDFIVVG